MRLGVPSGISGLVDMVNGPMYSTAVGLVIYAMKAGAPKRRGLTNGASHGSIRQTTQKIRHVLASVFK